MEEKYYAPPENWEQHPYITKLTELKSQGAFRHFSLYNLPKARRGKKGAHNRYRGWRPTMEMQQIRDAIDNILATGRVPTDQENQAISSQVSARDYEPCAELARLGIEYCHASPDARADEIPRGEMLDGALDVLTQKHKLLLGVRWTGSVGTRLAKVIQTVVAGDTTPEQTATPETFSTSRVTGWVDPNRVPTEMQRYYDLPAAHELRYIAKALRLNESDVARLHHGLENTLQAFAEKEESILVDIDSRVAGVLAEIKKGKGGKYLSISGFGEAFNDLLRANGFCAYGMGTPPGRLNYRRFAEIYTEQCPEGLQINTKYAVDSLRNLTSRDRQAYEAQLTALAPLLRLDQQEGGLETVQALMHEKHGQKHSQATHVERVAREAKREIEPQPSGRTPADIAKEGPGQPRNDIKRG